MNQHFDLVSSSIKYKGKKTHLYVGDVQLCACRNDVCLVDSSDWDAVDLEWSSDEEQSAFELLEKDDTFSSEPSSEENQDSSWCDGGA